MTQEGGKISDKNDLNTFLELRNLDQISTRLYYLYYRIIDTLREDNQSRIRYSHDLITGIIGGFMGFVSFFIFLKDLDNIFKIISVIITISVIVILIYIRETKKSKNSDYENFNQVVQLAINLDQVFKQANQCLLLLNMLENNRSDDVKIFLSDSIDLLSEFIGHVETSISTLKSDPDPEVWKDALKKNHYSEESISRRLDFGKRVLNEVTKFNK